MSSLDNHKSKSYHQGLHLIFNWKSAKVLRYHSHRQIIWDYSHANFDKASQIIYGTVWNILFLEDIDVYCAHWQHMFLYIMEQCIHKKVLPSRRCNLPWLNKHLVQSMRRRNCLFRKMKRSNNLIYKKQYNQVRNNVTYQLPQAKEKYFQNLNPSNAKHFWKTVKTLSKPNSCVSFLTYNGNPCSFDSDKTNAMNFFSKCFIISYPPISTTTIINHSAHQRFCAQ